MAFARRVSVICRFVNLRTPSRSWQRLLGLQLHRCREILPSTRTSCVQLASAISRNMYGGADRRRRNGRKGRLLASCITSCMESATQHVALSKVGAFPIGRLGSALIAIDTSRMQPSWAANDAKVRRFAMTAGTRVGRRFTLQAAQPHAPSAYRPQGRAVPCNSGVRQAM
jgi:hypothetical protein